MHKFVPKCWSCKASYIELQQLITINNITFQPPRPVVIDDRKLGQDRKTTAQDIAFKQSLSGDLIQHAFL